MHTRGGRGRGRGKGTKQVPTGPCHPSSSATRPTATPPSAFPTPTQTSSSSFFCPALPGMSEPVTPPVFDRFPVNAESPVGQTARRKVHSKGRAQDFFSGTGSVANRLRELGYEVITLDIDPRTNPTICCSVGEWDYSEYPPGFFKIIAASVPCAEYSLAKTTAPREFERANVLVCQVMNIVEYFQPKIWWVENTRYG